MATDYSIRLCAFCGNKTSGKLCPGCKTKDQRKQKILDQLEIEKENEKKGFKVSNKLFGFERKALLELYKLCDQSL